MEPTTNTSYFMMDPLLNPLCWCVHRQTKNLKKKSIQKSEF